MPKLKIVFMKALSKLQFFFHLPDSTVVETRQILSQQKTTLAHSELNLALRDQE